MESIDVLQKYIYKGIDNKDFFTAYFNSDEEANAFRRWLMNHKIYDTLTCIRSARKEIISEIQFVKDGFKYLPL